MINSMKLSVGLLILLLLSHGGWADVFEVGDGYTYATIQAAIDDANDFDEVIIHAGTYGENVNILDRSNMYIHAAAGDRVTIKGMFSLYNPDSSAWSDNNLIEGIYFDKLGVAGGWCVQHQYARSNTYKDCVFFGDGSGANGVYGNLLYGLNIARHCTFIGLGTPYSNGYAAGLHLFDCIVAFNTNRPYNHTAIAPGVATYSCFHNNPDVPNLPENVGSVEGTIYVDPEFVTTDALSEDFLVLAAGSPCIGTASDSGNMGATPRAPAYSELTVGTGKEYATIQAAVDAAVAGDIITVFAGIYEETVTLNVTAGAPHGLTLRANPGDLVVLVGTFSLRGTSTDLIDGTVIDGFYIDMRNRPTNNWGIYCSYARSNTFRNCVIFGNGGGTSGSGVYGISSYGLNIASHCTITGTYNPYSNGDSSGLHVYDCIVAFNDAGTYNSISGVVQHSCFYQNGGDAGLPSNIGSTIGTITANPRFVSQEVACENYLWLDEGVSPCVGTAADGDNMGAMPATTELACIQDVDAPGDPAWQLRYTGSPWPTNDPPGGAWGGYGEPVAGPEWAMTNYYGYGEPQSYPGEGWFRLRTSPGGYLYYTKESAPLDPNCLGYDVDFSVGATLEARLQLYTDGTYYSDGGCGMTIHDGAAYAAVNFMGNPGDPCTYLVRLSGGSGDVTTDAIDTTQWHTYRLVVQGHVAALFVDGADTPILTNTTVPSTAPTGYVQWGDLSSGGAGYAYWDYIKAYTDGAIPDVPAVLSSNPASGETLPRGANNVIEIVTAGTIGTLPGVPLNIVQVGTATDLGAAFSYSLATTHITDDTLVATEDGSVLQDGTWYHIAPTGGWIAPFRIDVTVLRGDVTNDAGVNLPDLAAISGAWLDTVEAADRADLDGSGAVDPADLSVLGDGWLGEAGPNPWIEVDLTEYAGNPVMSYGSEPIGAATIGNLHVCVRKKDAVSPYMMWYTGDVSSGVRRIYLATSPDGITWTKLGEVLSETGAHTHQPSVLWDASAGMWKMWYTSGSPYAIYHATSWDGQTWSKHAGNPVFAVDPNPSAWDATSVRSPAVVYDTVAGHYKMWYWGNNDSSAPGTYGEYGTGLATSPDGINWTRVGQVSDESNLITNDVVQIDGVFYSFHNLGPHIGYAVSLDGVAWDNDPMNPLIYAGSGWKVSYIQAPSIVYDAVAGELKVFFNSGDYSKPADGTEVGLATTPFAP